MSQGLTPVHDMINRILIVEGNREQAEALKKFLSSKNYKVEIAKDSGQAHAAFTVHIPDFVILELILPNQVTGFEVCERMKKNNPNIPVLVLTEIDMDDARSLAKRVGADGYMVKPFDAEELSQQIFAIAEDVWRKRHLKDSAAMTEKVRFFCHECNKRLKVNASHRGRTLNCPRCGQPITVPLHG